MVPFTRVLVPVSRATVCLPVPVLWVDRLSSIVLLGARGRIAGVAVNVLPLLVHVRLGLVLLLFLECCPCPGLNGWNELQGVLGVLAVAFLDLSEEGRALPTPASVTRNIAGDAVCLLGLGALAGPVPLHTVAADVSGGDALIRIVVPSMTLQASCWLFLDLLDTCPAAANNKTIGYGSVGGVSVSKGEDKVGCLLPRGPSLDGLYPSHPNNCVVIQMVRLADRLSVPLVVWVKR